MRNHKLIVINFLLLLFLIAGCSSKPSENEMKQRIEKKINQRSDGLIKLIGFRKTNGIEREFGGVRLYEMKWIVDLEFTDDCMWNKSNFSAIPPPSGIDFLLHTDKQKAGKGQHVSLSGSTTLQKTENGWTDPDDDDDSLSKLQNKSESKPRSVPRDETKSKELWELALAWPGKYTQDAALVKAKNLIAQGASANIDWHNKRTIELAVTSGDISFVKLLLSNGATLIHSDLLRTKPKARLNGEMIDLFLKAGMDIDMEDVELLDNGSSLGCTELTMAINDLDEKGVEILISKGANVNKVATCGTPLGLAIKIKSQKIEEILRKNGATVAN